MADFDFTDFWEPSNGEGYGAACAPLTDEVITDAEKKLGYKLPASYLAMLRSQNGGTPVKSVIKNDECEIYLQSFVGIGSERTYSMFGQFGADFWFAEWSYPRIGVPVALTISGGHEIVFLDYSSCGSQGEPCVTLIDQECDYRRTKVAENFAQMLTMLVTPESLEDSEAEREETLAFVRTAPLGHMLSALCNGFTEIPEVEKKIRALCEGIVSEKGFFAMHDDDKSTLVYGLILMMYLQKHTNVSRDDFLKVYPEFLALPIDNCKSLGTHGYAPAFVSNWIDSKIASGDIVVTDGNMKLSDAYRLKIVKDVNASE